MAGKQSQPILLQGGTVLIHSANDHIEARKTSVLVVDSVIAEIADSIKAPAGTKVIDCTDKIISPGFIDTHHHVWQTLLKGRHADSTLLEYFPEGVFTSSLYDAEDFFWAELTGCLEMLECGTTTVVDFANINYTPEINDRAIAATAASGIRSVYCYSPIPIVKSWTPFEVDMNALAGHVLPTFDKLAGQAPWADGRVTLGFGFDAFHFLPKEYLDGLMKTLSQHQIELITYHYARGPVLSGSGSVTAKLNELGILDKRFLVAHSSNLTQEDADIYAKHGVHVASTPTIESYMSMGVPVAAFRDNLGKDLPQRSSLGVDCHSVTLPYLPHEAKYAMQSARAVYGAKFLEHNKQNASVQYTVEEAFNLATIRGARAAKMEAKTGSIAKGKAADLLVFSTTSPGMLAAAQQDPIAAIISHSSPSDIETVIVDGIVRKDSGKLTSVVANDAAGRQKVIEWKDIVHEILERRKVTDAKIKKLDLDDALDRLMDAWSIDRSAAMAQKAD